MAALFRSRKALYSSSVSKSFLEDGLEDVEAEVASDPLASDDPANILTRIPDSFCRPRCRPQNGGEKKEAAVVAS